MFGLFKRSENGELPTDEIIYYYHEEFVKALETLGFVKPPPSLVDLDNELSKHGTLIVLFALIAIPLLLADWETMKIEDMLGSGDDKDFKRKLYELPVCRQILQREMKYWLEKGWF